MTYHQAFADATGRLRRHSCQRRHAAREAEALLAAATKKTKEQLLSLPRDARLTVATKKRLDGFISRRLRHEPLEYIVGRAVFFGHEFSVRPGVLIPRPATEYVVAAAIDDFKEADRPYLFDVGTGSGCIAVTLAKEIPGATVVATDTSQRALQLAKTNATALDAVGSIVFLRSPLLGPHAKKIPSGRRIGIIANLPYLPDALIKKLPKEIVSFEPHTALFGGKDGLDHYRDLLHRLAESAITATILYLEILPRQRKPLSAFAKQLFPGAEISPITAENKNVIGLRIALDR